MITLEVNLLCEEKGDCEGSCATGEPRSCFEEALASAIEAAITHNWEVGMGPDNRIRAFCPRCLRNP